MKNLKSKLLGIIVSVAAVIMFIAVSVFASRLFEKNYFLETPYMFLEGKYSIDGGEWKTIKRDEPINETFHKIKFVGKLPSVMRNIQNELTITTKNVWFRMQVKGGETVIEHRYISFEEMCSDFEGENRNQIDNYDKVYEEYKSILKKNHPFSFDLPDTPGYFCGGFNLALLAEAYPDPDTEYIIEFENPYDFAQTRFSDIFTVTISDGIGVHQHLIESSLPLIMLFAVICLFGIFFFPVAGFILGRVDFSYLSFGVLCFFWGLYMAMQTMSAFMNYWISDTTACLFIDRMNSHFFTISLLVYFRSNLTRPLSRAISGVMTICVTIGVIISAAFHISAVRDMVVTGAYLNIIIGITAVVFIIMLSLEIKKSRSALFSMILWTPMIMGLILDIFNQFICFSSLRFFTYGLAVTMVAQIVRTVLGLRRQYLESIRYQQMQKELYEAKVQVMVSQIRPHFMYNALSSIAMLCKLKPDVAYEATIKFSDYLRGNMDSLKQTTPVPFKMELEHLEKYLYIEKLRFGKKLNIEYDIQAQDFDLPLLSVQPLVENAVKHGVGMKEDGGTVTIATRETDTYHEIIVSDDGVGFDTNEVKNDGRSHIGMENTKRRLKDMCNAEVIITSVIGEGTTAKIVIPKSKEENK